MRNIGAHESRSTSTSVQVGGGSKTPHLSPGLVDPVAQTHDLLELGHVRRDDEHVRLADELPERAAERLQRLRGHVRDGDLEALPSCGDDPQLRWLSVRWRSIMGSLCELERGGAADAAGGAGDERNAAGVQDGVQVVGDGHAVGLERRRAGEGGAQRRAVAAGVA